MKRNIWAGLDIGVETTSLCVLDAVGQVLQAATCPTDLGCIDHEIRWLRRRRHAKVGLEASGGLAIARGLRSRGYSVELYETRQLSKFLRARRNKTDAGDAIGIAEAGRMGASLISKVHLKDFESQALQSRLTIRRYYIRERVAAVNLLCRQLEIYGARITRCTTSMQLRNKVEAAIRKLFGKRPSSLASELRQLLDHCEKLIQRERAVDCELSRVASENETCRRFMQIPGVGVICALTFYATIAEPHRFKRSSDVGCYLGLTPKIHQSGLTFRTGRISRMGSSTMRSLLVRSSISFMKAAEVDADLKKWALGIEERRGKGAARVALARKLAIVMLAMWKTGDTYRASPSIEASR